MRRPLCAISIGMLGVGLLCAFLPQTVLFVPLAAFFALCAGLLLCRRTRKLSLCLLLGAVVGLAAIRHTEQSLYRLQQRYGGQRVLLTAEVLEVAQSYEGNKVDATLRVKTVGGREDSFLVQCGALPECEAGDEIEFSALLTVPQESERLTLYADGVALEAEYQSRFKQLGKCDSFRAKTARLRKRLSEALRKGMGSDEGGVLAAMAVGDRSCLTTELRSAYRGAGMSHVLVVSGLHVSILCGDLSELLPCRPSERSARRRRLQAVWKAVLALLLVGITGFTPSVERAAVAVWISALGVWLNGAPDALTSLSVAGILMTAANSYAVCDIGFELSFTAVLGTLAGAECSRRLTENENQRTGNARDASRRTKMLSTVRESFLVSLCASVATFPVLVLQGLSISLYAVVSSVAVLWLVQPMLLCGILTAMVGLTPSVYLYRALALAATALTKLLDGWAVWLAQFPGANLYFNTNYAVVIWLILLALALLGWHWRVRLRVMLPCLLLAALLAAGAGNALERDVVRVDLVGSESSPTVILSKNGTAVVLYRGGNRIRARVETVLARRGVCTVELAVDLRQAGQAVYPFSAQRKLIATKLPYGTVRQYQTASAEVEILRTQNGCLVRLTVGDKRLVALSGEVSLPRKLAADWLLASSTEPDAVSYQAILALGNGSAWMNREGITPDASELALR